jgi:hypothetical protein
MCGKGECDNTFPKEKCLSVSTTHSIWLWDWEDEKIEGLKYFEIYDIQEKEPPFSMSTYFNFYQPNWHGHLPKAEEENITASNVFWSDHPSKRPISTIQHTTSDQRS